MLRHITPTVRAVAAASSRKGLRYNSITQISPVRSFASYVDFDDDLDNWPRTKMNTFLNVCPQGEQMVVERLGKLDAVREGGWFFAIPLVDQITFVVDMREKALSIAPQSCITKDNVKLEVSGNLYCQFNDAQKAAYGSKNPIHAVKQHAQSSMRAAIGELELDEILHARAQLNTIVRTTVQEAAESWGLVIKRYEITEGVSVCVGWLEWGWENGSSSMSLASVLSVVCFLPLAPVASSLSHTPSITRHP